MFKKSCQAAANVAEGAEERLVTLAGNNVWYGVPLIDDQRPLAVRPLRESVTWPSGPICVIFAADGFSGLGR